MQRKFNHIAASERRRLHVSLLTSALHGAASKLVVFQGSVPANDSNKLICLHRHQQHGDYLCKDRKEQLRACAKSRKPSKKSWKQTLPTIEEVNEDVYHLQPEDHDSIAPAEGSSVVSLFISSSVVFCTMKKQHDSINEHEDLADWTLASWVHHVSNSPKAATENVSWTGQNHQSVDTVKSIPS